MFAVLAGTNRPNSNTLRIAKLVHEELLTLDPQAVLLDLQDLPPELLTPAAYTSKPEAFAAFQKTILECEGLIVVTPEYNGGAPGILKYTIDMLKFPESLYELPTAFVGLSAGPTGAIRPIEHLTQIFQYRNAHVYGRRTMLPSIQNALDARGRLKDRAQGERLHKTVEGFVDFTRRLRAAKAES